MTHRFFLAAAFCFTVAVPAVGQDTETLAREYVSLPGVQGMMDDILSAEALAAQLMASLPPGVEVSDQKRLRIGELFAERMREVRPDLDAALIRSAADTFTAPELEALIAFYQTEAGGSVMAKMQPMMAQFMAIMGPRMAEMQQSIVPELLAILQEPD